MKSSLVLITIFLNLVVFAQNTKNMSKNSNPLLCDPKEGICEISSKGANSKVSTNVSVEKPIKLIYFTDPICSSCWGIEPQLRKLKLEYGNLFEIEYHMGGLLPDWSYNSGGISKPSDVAPHWDEVSHHYNMPIDGDIWLEDPLSSSYPPSIAFKAAEMQDKSKALTFLRIIREMVFLDKKNITKWEHLQSAATKAKLDIVQFKKDYEGKATQKFQEDLALARQWNVRGFPSIFFIDSLNNQQFVYGFRPYAQYETAIKKLIPTATKQTYDTSWETLFKFYPTMTTMEFSEVSGLGVEVGEQILNKLYTENKIQQKKIKNGTLWFVK